MTPRPSSPLAGSQAIAPRTDPPEAPSGETAGRSGVVERDGWLHYDGTAIVTLPDGATMVDPAIGCWRVDELAAEQAAAVDHHAFTCPDPDQHSQSWRCCPCDHNLAGCCWHCPDVDPPGSHLHQCRTDKPTDEERIAAVRATP